jgi:hypothetical protein
MEKICELAARRASGDIEETALAEAVKNSAPRNKSGTKASHVFSSQMFLYFSHADPPLEQAELGEWAGVNRLAPSSTCASGGARGSIPVPKPNWLRRTSFRRPLMTRSRIRSLPNEVGRYEEGRGWRNEIPFPPGYN